MTKKTYKSLWLIVAFTSFTAFTSCSKEDPTNGATAQEEAAGFSKSPLFNQGESYVSLSTSLQSVNISNELNTEGEAKSWTANSAKINYIVKDANGKITDDDGNETSVAKKTVAINLVTPADRKFLVLFREKGATSLLYAQEETWEWDSDTNAYRPKKDGNQERPFSVTLTPGTAYEVAILTGGKLDGSGTNYTWELGLGRGYLVKASGTELDIPFQSKWVEIKSTTTNGKTSWAPVASNYSTASTIKLYPVGTLMVASLRNSTGLQARVTKAVMISNYLVPKVKLALNGAAAAGADPTTFADANQKELSGNSIYVRVQNQAGSDIEDYGYRYYKQELSGLSSVNIPTDGTQSSDVVVYWAYPMVSWTGAEHPKYNPTVTSDPLAAGFQQDQFTANAKNIIYPQTHFYAVVSGALAQNEYAPNFEQAPIMGTDKALQLGKAYSVPCELYLMPGHQTLGLLAKFPVATNGNFPRYNASGENTGGNAGNEIDGTGGTGDGVTKTKAKYLLVNYAKAKNFLPSFSGSLSSGAKVTVSGGASVSGYPSGTTYSGTYYMTSTAWTNFLGYTNIINYVTDNGLTNFGTFKNSATSTVGRLRAWAGVLPYLEKDGQYSERNYTIIDYVQKAYTTATDGDRAAYRLAYREIGSEGTLKRSPYQQIIRLGQGVSGLQYTNNGTRSVYVGKYFVGTPLTPYYTPGGNNKPLYTTMQWTPDAGTTAATHYKNNKIVYRALFAYGQPDSESNPNNWSNEVASTSDNIGNYGPIWITDAPATQQFLGSTPVATVIDQLVTRPQNDPRIERYTFSAPKLGVNFDGKRIYRNQVVTTGANGKGEAARLLWLQLRVWSKSFQGYNGSDNNKE